MSTDEIRTLLGEPDKIVPRETNAGPIEAWLYRSSYTAGTRHVQTGTQTYVRENLVTGVPETIEEPILGVENIYATEEITLVLRDGKLLEWATTKDRSLKIN